MSIPRCHKSTSCIYELTVYLIETWPPLDILSTVRMRAWSINMEISRPQPSWGLVFFTYSSMFKRLSEVDNNCSFLMWIQSSKHLGEFLCQNTCIWYIWFHQVRDKRRAATLPKDPTELMVRWPKALIVNEECRYRKMTRLDHSVHLRENKEGTLSVRGRGSQDQRR